MIDLDVIVKQEDPTEWVSSLVIHVVKKDNGKIRVCLDAKDLNRAFQRSHYQMPTADEIFSKMGRVPFLRLWMHLQGIGK